MNGVVALVEMIGNDRVLQARLPDGTSVLLDLNNQRVITLNETATALMGLVAQGERDIAAMGNAIAREFGVGEEQARADVEAFIREAGSLLCSR